MKPFSSLNEAVTHWNNFFLEQEAALLQIEPFAKITKKEIEALFASYEQQLNKHILFAQAPYGYHSPELAKLLEQRLQGMVHYTEILKNHLLYENTLILKEKEEILNSLNKQVLTELTQIGLENPKYKNLTDQFCLHMDFKYSPEKHVELAKKIKSTLSESDLQNQHALTLVLNAISFAEKKMNRAEYFLTPDLKNKLSFFRRELVTSELTCQFFSQKISLLEQAYNEFINKEEELEEKTLSIQHLKYPFRSLLGEARRHLAIIHWNNMIGLVDRVFLALNIPENTGSLEYKDWPNFTKYFLATTLIPVLNAYRESFNHIENIFELIPDKPPSLLHESNRQRLEEIFSEIEETLKILQALVPFIQQIVPKSEGPEQLINKFEIWIEKKRQVIDQHLSLPPSSPTIEQKDLDLQISLFKSNFFEPKISDLEKKILSPHNSIEETKSLLLCYQEQINNCITSIEDPNLVSRDLLKTVLTQHRNKIAASVKLLEVLTPKPEQNLIASFIDSAQKEISSIQAHCLDKPKHHRRLEKGLRTLTKIRKIDKRTLDVQKCLFALQAVKAIGTKQGIACVTLDQFIDALEHLMLELKPAHLATLSAMNGSQLQKGYLQFYLQQKELLDLRQIIDPSAQQEESPIKTINAQLFGKALPQAFCAFSEQAHKKESELRTQLSELKAQLGVEDPIFSVETPHRAPYTTTLDVQNTQQKKPISHAASNEEGRQSLYPHPTLPSSSYSLFPPHPPSRKRKPSAALPEDEHLSVKRPRLPS